MSSGSEPEPVFSASKCFHELYKGVEPNVYRCAVEIGTTEGRIPIGETKKRPFQLCLNKFLRIDFQGSGVMSDGGLILVRELEERFGFKRAD